MKNFLNKSFLLLILESLKRMTSMMTNSLWTKTDDLLLVYKAYSSIRLRMMSFKKHVFVTHTHEKYSSCVFDVSHLYSQM